MVQVSRPERLESPQGAIFNQYDKNLGLSTTSSFVTVLTVESIPIRESVFIIHNKGAGDLDWQILGNAEDLIDIVAPTGTNDDDKGWVVLKASSVASGAAPSVETLSNPYTQVVVRLKHTTTTTDVDIWHRGEN